MQYFDLINKSLFTYKFEILAVISGIILGISIGKLLQKVIPGLARPKVKCIFVEEKSEVCITSTMFLFLTTIFILYFESIFYKIFGSDGCLIDIAYRITFISLLIYFAFVNSKKNIFRQIISVMLLCPISLIILNVIQPTILYLDNLGISIGKENYSIFLIIKAVYIIVLLMWIWKTTSAMVEKSVRKQREWSANTREILIKLVNVILAAILFMLGLNLLGINFAAFNIFSGALGVGLGLSLQKISSNFLSGIILLFEKNIQVEDIIELPNDIKGRVKYLGARATIIDTLGGNEMVVPNDELINSKLVNLSNSGEIVKIIAKVPASYDADPEIVQNILLKVVRNHLLYQKIPAPDCMLTEYAEKFASYQIEFWAKTPNKAQVKSEIMTEIWKEFQKAGIKFVMFDK